MLGLLAYTFQLVRWNRDTDPRFYRFLGTPPGQFLSRVMDWPNLHLIPTLDKPLEEYTDEERLIRIKLESQLENAWPTHVLTLNSGEQEYVRVVGRSASGLDIQSHFGGRGRLVRFIPRSTLQSEVPYTDPPPRVTWRDVSFQMEYPDFHLEYFGHYTVLTDAPYFQVESSVHELETLRTQFMKEMGELVRFPKADQGLQVLFFRNEEQYRTHQMDSAPELSSSAGYYSPTEDRMVVFNQMHSETAKEIRKEVDDKIQQMLAQSTSSGDRRHILNMQVAVEDQMRARGEMETRATLRHEAAHHLAYTHGIHSWIHAENAWLIEGLAVYFEPPKPGQVPMSHINTLIRLSHEDRIPRLRDLMQVRLPKDFQLELRDVTTAEAYALSWTLFHFCMQPENREGFFDYLRMLQDPADIPGLMNASRSSLLAQHLGFESEALLERTWRKHLQRL